MLNRRGFLGSLLALPFAAKVVPNVAIAPRPELVINKLPGIVVHGDPGYQFKSGRAIAAMMKHSERFTEARYLDAINRDIEFASGSVWPESVRRQRP